MACWCHTGGFAYLDCWEGVGWVKVWTISANLTGVSVATAIPARATTAQIAWGLDGLFVISVQLTAFVALDKE